MKHDLEFAIGKFYYRNQLLINRRLEGLGFKDQMREMKRLIKELKDSKGRLSFYPAYTTEGVFLMFCERKNGRILFYLLELPWNSGFMEMLLSLANALEWLKAGDEMFADIEKQLFGDLFPELNYDEWKMLAAQELAEISLSPEQEAELLEKYKGCVHMNRNFSMWFEQESLIPYLAMLVPEWETWKDFDLAEMPFVASVDIADSVLHITFQYIWPDDGKKYSCLLFKTTGKDRYSPDETLELVSDYMVKALNLHPGYANDFCEMLLKAFHEEKMVGTFPGVSLN